MIRNQLDLEAETIAGDKGVFDVTLGDELIFSKFESGRFPEESEVIDLLKERVAGAN